MADQVTQTKEEFLRSKLHNFAKFVGELVPGSAERMDTLPDQPMETIFVWIRAYILPLKKQVLKRDRKVIQSVIDQSGFVFDAAAVSDEQLDKFCRYLELFLDVTHS